MMNNKITPSLWFSADGGNISSVNAYYKNIFGDAFQEGSVIPLGNTPSGNTEMCQVKIFNQSYSMMCTEQIHHPFNDAFSLIIHCEDQQEIDKYWNYFTQEGTESQCGWCKDKYGLRWQIIPNNLGELMRKPNAWKILMNQKKIVIEDYLK